MFVVVFFEEIFVVIIFSNKKNNLFLIYLSMEYKNVFFYLFETVLMKEGEKIFIFM